MCCESDLGDEYVGEKGWKNGKDAGRSKTGILPIKIFLVPGPVEIRRSSDSETVSSP